MIEMTDALIERVARALCYWSGDSPDQLIHPAKPLPVTHSGHAMVTSVDPVAAWTVYVGLARVAISAVRTAE